MAHAKIWATDAQVKILCTSEKGRKHFGRVSREKTTHSYIRPNESEKQLFEGHLKIAILEKNGIHGRYKVDRGSPKTKNYLVSKNSRHWNQRSQKI
jgi:hypothetical protein